MRYFLTIFALFVFASQSTATITFEKWFGGTDYDEGFSVAQTTDGGYIITGCRNWDPAGGGDVWLIKTDSNGNKQWDKTFGGSEWDGGYSVQETSGGYFFIAGYTSSYGAGGYDVWLIMTDSSGEKQWSETYGGSEGDVGRSLELTSDGGLVIAGYTESIYSPHFSGWLIKLDSEYEWEWGRAPGLFNFDIYSVRQTSDGGFILTGYTKSYGAGYSDVYLIKTDGSGNVVGIEESEESEIRITKSEIYVHPNPFMSVATIESQVSNIQIYDLSGRLVETVKGNIIGKNLKPGIYFLKAKGHKPVRVVKLR